MGWLSRRPHSTAVAVTALVALLIAGLDAAAPSTAQPSGAAPPAGPTQNPAGRYVPAGCNTGSDGQQRTARCYALGLANAHGQLVEDASAPPDTALGPADIQSAYQLPDAGAGQLVATVDAFGYDNAEADLAVFRAHYGLPPCTTANGCFTKLDQRGGTDYPPQNPDWSTETALDLDAISAACPKCHILLVQADDDSLPNLGAAVDTAAAWHPVAISNSYGVAGEKDYETDYDAHYDHPGIAVTVSSGDLGGLQSWPATNPDVVAVGGTYLERDASARGWHEQAWWDAGAGCSAYESRPGYQQNVNTGCPDGKATADISADADPASGLAVYNTLGQDGWAQWGGTSLSSPLVAAMYALAGDPVPGTYPVTYPYRATAAAQLFDITEGSAGFCSDQRCVAGPGWDGPTGLGTPAGVGALTLGPYGYVTGRVTDGRRSVAGATVTATAADGSSFTATTDGSGGYRLAAPSGTYTVAATKFGYRGATADDVGIGASDTTRDFTISELDTREVTGTVTDGSGQQWPLYARITVDGDPHGAIYTDPFTGRYDVQLPVGSDYTLHVAPVELPGYRPSAITVTVPAAGRGPSSAVHRDLALDIDATSCTATGYGYTYRGVSTGFEGWPATDAQDGWTSTDDAGSGQGWHFDDPGGKGNLTGGTGGFAIVDGWYYPGQRDASLISPPADLSDQTAPVIGFDTAYSAWGDQTGDVYLSIDGGKTWTDVWQARDQDVFGHVEIPVPHAAGQSDVRVKFRYTGAYDNWWEIDDVFLGSRSCDPTGGGLVAGVVRDDNTGAPLVGAHVGPAGSADGAVTEATPDDVAVPDGIYTLYSPSVGATALTAGDRNYAPDTASVAVQSHSVVRRDWSLQAGRLTVHPGAIAVTAHPRTGHPQSRQVQLTNTGTQPLHVDLLEQDRGFTPAGGAPASTTGAPRQVLHVHTSVGMFRPGRETDPSADVNPTAVTTAASAWRDLPDAPTPTMDNVVAVDNGIVYSVAGIDGSSMVAHGYAYDPDTGSWHPIADLPEPLDAPVGAFADGVLYVTGGWRPDGTVSTATYAYHPSSDRWTKVADLPSGISGGAAASLGGRLYVVGGCTTGDCEPASTAGYRYDPRSDSWQRIADYPQAVAFLACGGVTAGLVCAGGVDPASGQPSSSAYEYIAGDDSWTQVADLPYPDWGMAYSDAGGKLQVVGGVVGYAGTSNQGAEFDPQTGTWTPLPNANHAVYRGGGACGMYVVGGATFQFDATPYAEQLPDRDACLKASDAGWLSVGPDQLDLEPGQSVTITVTVDPTQARAAGEYDAQLAFATDTPYRVPPLPITLTVR